MVFTQSSLKIENHRLGSVRQIMDTAGNVVNYYTYEPFGETLESEEQNPALINWFLFTGQYYGTEIDQYYLPARQYDLYIYRFTSRGPLADQQHREPLRLYVYRIRIFERTKKCKNL